MGGSLPAAAGTRGEYAEASPPDFTQSTTLQNMYKGVLRDDERRLEKMRKREEDLQASLQKRELYEKLQPLQPNGEPDAGRS